MSVSDMSNCCSEVTAILDQVREEDYNKIPKDIIETKDTKETEPLTCGRNKKDD